MNTPQCPKTVHLGSIVIVVGPVVVGPVAIWGIVVVVVVIGQGKGKGILGPKKLSLRTGQPQRKFGNLVGLGLTSPLLILQVLFKGLSLLLNFLLELESSWQVGDWAAMALASTDDSFDNFSY